MSDSRLADERHAVLPVVDVPPVVSVQPLCAESLKPSSQVVSDGTFDGCSLRPGPRTSATA